MAVMVVSTVPHGDPNRWRAGCRCTPCRVAHTMAETGRRRAAMDAAFPPALRKRVLRLLTKGHAPAEVAERVGVSWQAMYARRRFDAQWATDLDEALTAGRDPDLPHGTETAYRHGRCRCPECRAAHRH